mmetsp:Transcript_86686/g.231422  ORF Transcript_86686/g.231422 Transcript_86686/m.231422 type:complete len:394 (+) Transcript_86686:3-1184(+)
MMHKIVLMPIGLCRFAGKSIVAASANVHSSNQKNIAHTKMTSVCRSFFSSSASSSLATQHARAALWCRHAPTQQQSRSFAVSTKDVFWNGARRSLDPTAPSIVPRKPTTPSQRHTKLIDKSLLWKKGPVPSLTVGLRKSGGRNNQGVITVRHRGGGSKRKLRIIDFKRVQPNNAEIVKATVERIEFDPNRSALIALLKHKASEGVTTPSASPLSYIICPRGITIGSELQASRKQGVDVRIGNSMQLRFIPVGTTVHNIELAPGRGAQMCRSAGTSAQLLEVDETTGKCLLRLQSKEQRYVLASCMATIGEVSNPEHKNQVLGKAGRARWMGRRPAVRGVAMNPVDHPHGGGEGKTHHGGPPRSPWGKLTKGFKTVRKDRPWIRVPRWKARRDK